MLTVFGSAALDTIRTPSRIVRDVLGGAATYAAVSASYFTNTGIVGVVGDDLGRHHIKFLQKYVDIEGLAIRHGRTFRYDGMYNDTLSMRKTLKTQVGVMEGFKPRIPDAYRASRFVYLANNDPEQNTAIIDEFDRVRFSMCDTIDYWIRTKRDAVIKMMGVVDAVVINDEEARLLVGHYNLHRCARRIQRWGAGMVIIKKGEHGSLLFYKDRVYAMPGVVIDRVVDPTGAGDSFAGGMMGYISASGSTAMPVIKKAMTYGNVMGSFAVQGYGLGGIRCITRSDIARRIRSYNAMTR